jgi:predicted transcriptional regulator of viral defense system
MRKELVKADAKVARIAARQHGVVTVAELAQAGLSAPAISRRVAAGRLHRIHRGVYAVGHRGLSQEGGWMAAVLPAVMARC